MHIETILHISLFKIAAASGNLCLQVVANGVNASVKLIGVECVAVLHICYASPCITATLSDLRGQTISKLCDIVSEGTNGIVNTSKVVVEGIVQSGEGVRNTVGLLVNLADEGLLVNGRADVSGSCTGAVGAVATALGATATVAIAITEATTECEKKYDYPILLS